MYCFRCGFEIEKNDSTEQSVMANGEQGRSHGLAKCFDLVNQDRKLWRENKSDGDKKAFYEAHPDGANPRPDPEQKAPDLKEPGRDEQAKSAGGMPAQNKEKPKATPAQKKK